MPFSLGSAKASPGRISYGTYPLFDQPTGGIEELPVVIAQGNSKGPTFWLTAGIHGNEHSGLQVLHLLLNRELVRQLHGTIVCIPALNPSGLQGMRRESYFHRGDPNRLFPDGKPKGNRDPDIDPPSILEQAYTRLFAEIKASANYWIDLHNTWTGSISMVYRDRVYYRNDGTAAQIKAAKAEAEKLDQRIEDMCRAYGHSVLCEMASEAYFDDRLHRSTTGAAVNAARIPGLTMELGTGHMPDPAIVQAALVGLKNVLRWAGMLDGAPEPVTGIKIVNLGYRCRRRSTPRVPLSCIVRHLVDAGDLVKQGDPIAEIRDIWGRPVGEKVLRSEYDGWIMGRTHGIVRYEGEEICGMGVRDDLPTVLPYPEGYFAK
ncbi:MAG: succinylglutamate desuccinylase/aspartoacylase family protein [Planctomycetes bacterium]|nr:succinylglutamate desuccinylase/aspartoacylase family protein [Planctomycetota bacterium]